MKKEVNKHKNMGAVRFDLQGVGILVRKRQVRLVVKKEENKHKNMGIGGIRFGEGALVKVRVSTYQEVGRDTIRRRRIKKRGVASC